MGTELVPETSMFYQLTRLIAREDFINVSRRESLRSYMYYAPSPMNVNDKRC
jgi:hypothetical protein